MLAHMAVLGRYSAFCLDKNITRVYSSSDGIQIRINRPITITKLMLSKRFINNEVRTNDLGNNLDFAFDHVPTPAPGVSLEKSLHTQ